MTILNLATIRAMKEDLYVPAARNAFGGDGEGALKHLLDSIIQLYKRIDPALRTKPLALFVDATCTPTVMLGISRHLTSIPTITTELDDACMVRINADGSLDATELNLAILVAVSQSAIVYLYNASTEKIIIRGYEYRLKNPVYGYASVFCKPTFKTLESALDRYRLNNAAHTTCLILENVWYEECRWWFKKKPEHIMRRSLWQFLHNVLEDAEVRPEQNVDETHPVDIRVSFSSSDQRAIIEIKWLGESVDECGKPTTSYTAVRAREGAKQLADYLDSSCKWGSGVRTRGYLVVFDGRRKGLTQGITSLDTANAMHYRNQEIDYDPDYSAQRDDFHMPMRMFMYAKTAS